MTIHCLKYSSSNIARVCLLFLLPSLGEGKCNFMSGFQCSVMSFSISSSDKCRFCFLSFLNNFPMSTLMIFQMFKYRPCLHQLNGKELRISSSAIISDSAGLERARLVPLKVSNRVAWPFYLENHLEKNIFFPLPMNSRIGKFY